ncbi:helix-turn-helix domain-containing protein [Zobellia alginiliquefaciens]|uniref:helix-turn-helix domain-containing protein n=1 Tax=Zobellia alginiliquefaciens TaxID=3032586 RepID=UPI0023E0C67E|nr:helix-turn-helix domain-containing protein [Zobellia alginiliquefaciens]
MSKNLSKGSKATPSQGRLIDKLRKEIELNLDNDQFGVDSLAQAVGMSRSSLHRKLHKVLGISTSQFIREYRLKRALKILQEEDITASETAYRVGFSSATYFNTCFHKYHGYTPGEVKSKSTEEIEKVFVEQSTPIDRDGTKKRMLWVAMSATVVCAVVFYFYNSAAKENKDTVTLRKPANEKSIVVLPFKNLTGDTDLEYVSDGMTDAIISKLTEINSIKKVVPFTSTLSYKGTNKTIKEIVTELDVENLLQGNLQISGNQIKVKLQLIDGTSNNHLWSKEYVREWKTDEIFTIQTEVVEGVASSMSAIITDSEMVYVKTIPTKSKQAYSYYLQAEYQRYKSNEATFDLAMPLYKKAIALDSSFVEAYLGLASIWSFGGMVWGLYNEQTAWKNAKSLLEHAYELDPSNQEVEEELYTGNFYYEWNFEMVEQFYQTKSKGSFYVNTPIINTDYAIKMGRYHEAIENIDKHLLRDPSLIGVFFCRKAEALMFLGNSKGAIDLLNSTVLPYSDNLFYLRESAKQYFYLGEHEKSKTQLKKIFNQFPDYPPLLMWLNAVFAQIDGNTEAISKHLAELHAKYENGSSGSPAWFIALYYAHTKDYESTFEWLQKSYDRHEVEMTWLREEPLLAPIRNDSRYKDLYENVGFSSIGLPIKSSLKN